MRRKRILSKKEKEYLKVGLGTPLAFGTTAFVFGSLPGTMGTLSSSALSGATPMVGVVSKIGMLGFGYEMAKKTFPSKRELKELGERYG